MDTFLTVLSVVNLAGLVTAMWLIGGLAVRLRRAQAGVDMLVDIMMSVAQNANSQPTSAPGSTKPSSQEEDT